MNLKRISAAILISLMLIGAFATSGLVTVQAPNPHQGSLTVHLVLDVTDIYGMHAIAHMIKEEFAKIGITVELDFRETSVIWDTCAAGPYYNATWDDEPNKGWDMGFWFEFGSEFFGMASDLLWFDWWLGAANYPPYGQQIMGYNNTKADELLHLCLSTLDPVKRREYALLYQEEVAHDPPALAMYAPILIDVCDARFQTTWGTPGYDLAIWTLDPDTWTWVEDPMPDKVVVKVGLPEDLWNYNPVLLSTYSQSHLQGLCTHSTLYTQTKIPGTPPGEGYTTKPVLATGPPIWSEDGKTCDVYLRNDVYWHNFTDVYTDPGNPVEYINEKFTADDVLCSYEALMDPDTGSWGIGDFLPWLDTSVFPGGVEKIDDYHVRFHLLKPCAFFETLTSDTWGGLIVPEHILGDVPHADWWTHWTNTEFPPPGTGPFQFVERVAGEYWKTKANPAYWKGKPIIDEMIYNVITDPAAAWTALTTHEIHFGVIASWTATPDQLDAARADPTLSVYDNPVGCTRHILLNLRHPVLSNRYVRQAMLHAIDYKKIVDEILPAAGLKGIIWPSVIYPLIGWATDPTRPPPYEYNITKAQQYMDMWRYSLPEYAPPGSAEVDLGPIGDADFSGFVELADFYIWVRNFGTTPAEWLWYPGRDIDPDFDNTEFVELPDFYDWTGGWGKHYPFKGAR